MTDYLLGEYVDNLNEIVKQPIQSTQRIKYTCCDVSKNYIVFGASSGGLYIFHRYPCYFDKLIPSTEGYIVQILISLDEKLICFATSKGTICLVDLTSKNLDFQIYNEHIGNIITCMKWNELSNEIFAGDNTGKISVITQTNFITKSMFQNLCSPILKLDSKIIQLDTLGNFLLVSTLTRCYICDTLKEQYRQIGQKLRDGEFGACFFGSNSLNIQSTRAETQSGVFKILNDKESFNSVESQNFKIFCARPGFRLWEVNNNGSVLRTHQFKQALNEPKDIIAIKDKDSQLELIQNKLSSHINQFNFIKMFSFNNMFIITYKIDGIYILDPINGKVILWTNKYSNIINIKIVKSQIYIVTKKLKIHNLLLATLENFILKSYLNKQYKFCTDICLKYEQKLKELISNSSKLHILKGLKEKVQLSENLTEILDNFEPKVLTKKLENGIFLIENAHNINDNFEASCNENNELDFTNEIKKIYEQYELDKIIGNYNTKVLTDILNEYNLDNIYNIFTKFQAYALIQNAKKTEIQKWCHEQILLYLYTNKDYVLVIFNLSLNDNIGIYIKDAFLNLNNCTDSCICHFPLPKASSKVPKFFKIGCCILEKLKDSTLIMEFCKKVPYMWGQVIKMQQNDNIINLLPLIIQYSDVNLIELFLKKFTYDIWHEALKLYIFLISGKCLNCDKKICVDSVISWEEFSNLILKSIGAESTIELLLHNSDNIPKNSLNVKFYQSLIFSSIATNFDPNVRKQSIDFVNNIANNGQQKDFEKLMGKHLMRSSRSTVTNSIKKDVFCTSCNLPLQVPVLNRENSIFLNCSHKFHNICYKNQKNLCNICMLN